MLYFFVFVIIGRDQFVYSVLECAVVEVEEDIVTSRTDEQTYIHPRQQGCGVE